MARELRRRGDAPRIVAVTNEPDSSLAALADLTLGTRAGEETGPSTMTFAAALVVLGALVAGDRGHGRRRGASTVCRSRPRWPPRRSTTCSARETLADDLVTWHGGRATTVILARGGARAAAEMGALTLKEAVGHARRVAADRAVPPRPARAGRARPRRDGDRDRARDARPRPRRWPTSCAVSGTAVWTVTAGVRAPGATDVGPIDRLLAPAAAIVPAQLLAWRLAILAGREPGAYVHAAKVTTHE